MKQVLKVDFSDFWPGFSKEDNLLVNLLKVYFEVELSSNPDVLFYSCYSFNHTKYKCYKIFYTAENVRPNYNECDLSLTFDYPDYNNRNIRLPLYRWRGDLENLLQPKAPEKILEQKTEFCCMLVSNPDGKERNEFHKLLSKYKRIDSGGSYLNNVGGRVSDKSAFIKKYKFVLSFENASFKGYTSEKLVEPLLTNSLPVYWGNPLIADDFNSKSFINVHEYASFEKAIEEIIRIDNDDNAFLKYLAQPYFANNRLPVALHYEVIAQKLFEGITRIKKNKPVASFPSNRIMQTGIKYRKILVSTISKKPHWYC
jgi:alpha(1,3/1,4) fucosyltransferase